MNTNNNSGLALIFARNAFYKRLHYLVLAAFALSILVIGILTWVLYFLVKNPPQPLFFATDDAGRLVEIVPLDKPNMSTDEVIAWTIEAFQRSASYDFVNYRTQLQDAQKYFTEYGWSTYMKAMTLANNMPALIQRKQIVIAQVVSRPKIVAQGILGGAYAWKFEMPVLVTYWLPPYNDKSKFLNSQVVTVIVQRQEILKSYKGLGIVQLVAQLATDASAAPQEISSTPTAR